MMGLYTSMCGPSDMSSSLRSFSIIWRVPVFEEFKSHRDLFYRRIYIGKNTRWHIDRVGRQGSETLAKQPLFLRFRASQVMLDFTFADFNLIHTPEWAKTLKSNTLTYIKHGK